ncbi:MAG: TetR/AcrR family transcriptional regulator [bacterium]|jgi:AcrR family transcriptional regulator|nr:TetR/AcrR family transcriptional regulator [bacterium]
MEQHSKHLPADARRAVTVEAVIDLAAVQNPNEITTAAIAARMHLSQGALFRHFPTKDDLWLAVMEWVAEHLLRRVDRAHQAETSPLAALEAIFLAHIDFVAQHPGVPRMLFCELQRQETTPAKTLVQSLLQRYGERLHRLIDQGKTCGEIDPSIDPHVAATQLIGIIQGLVIQSLIAGGSPRMKKTAPAHFTIFRRGIENQS